MVRAAVLVVAAAGVAMLALTAAVSAADPPVVPPPAGAPLDAPPRPIVVALSLRDPVLQAGVVKGREVILARGFEAALARVLARRLGVGIDRFVYVPSRTRLLAVTGASWDLALDAIERPPAGRADLTAPYLTSDVAVVTRRGLPRPGSLSALRGASLCAVRGSAGAAAAAGLRPRVPVLAVPGLDRLRSVVRTGSCDAALVPAVQVGRLLARQRALVGPVVGRVRRGDGIGASVPAGSSLDRAAVDRELARLRRDGTLGRLARLWLGLDPAALPVIR
jgi:ABC-type amino acid transport substrate-binding protein